MLQNPDSVFQNETLPIRGWFYPAGSAQRSAAVLTVAGGWAELRSPAGAPLLRAPRNQLVIDAPIGTAPRKIALPGGALFESDDHAAIDAMAGPTRGGMLHRAEAFRPRLFAVVALCLAAGWALWRYGLDMLVALAIWVTPPAVVAQMDKGTLQLIDFSMANASDLAQADRDRVMQIFTDLTAALPGDVQAGHQFTLLFRDMPSIGPNAFALPGGTMIVTDDFVTQFPEADILAGVLGHEIGHVVHQDGLTRLYRSLGGAVLIAFLAGDVGPILEDVVLEGNVLLSLSHSRGQERDADAFGVTLAAKAGYNPAGLMTFFQRIRDVVGDYEGAEWLSTHPLSGERVQQIESYIKGLAP